MIVKKEFYFVRHGQTDHNLMEGKDKLDFLEDIALNETGKSQAKSIQPFIASLPIKSLCSSPLRRAQETREIIAGGLSLGCHVIEDLGECSYEIWKEMVSLGADSSLPEHGVVRHFIDRVRTGMDQALSFPSPPLIVAHGGVHWALCWLLGIDKHRWTIGNCVPVHFLIDKKGAWTARILRVDQDVLTSSL